MEPQDAVDIAKQAIQACILVGGPILLVGLIVGLVIGTLQSMTGIHDQTVSFVPKILLTIFVIALALPWLSQRMVDYTRAALQRPIIQISVDSTSSTWD